MRSGGDDGRSEGGRFASCGKGRSLDRTGEGLNENAKGLFQNDMILAVVMASQILRESYVPADE